MRSFSKGRTRFLRGHFELLPEAASLVVKFAELRRKIPDLLVVNSDVILPRFTLFKQRFQRFALVRRCESGNRFPFHAVEVVLEPVKRSLTERRPTPPSCADRGA